MHQRVLLLRCPSNGKVVIIYWKKAGLSLNPRFRIKSSYLIRLKSGVFISLYCIIDTQGNFYKSFNAKVAFLDDPCPALRSLWNSVNETPSRCSGGIDRGEWTGGLSLYYTGSRLQTNKQTNIY